MIFCLEILPINLVWSQPFWLTLIPLIAYLFWRKQKTKKDNSYLAIPAIGQTTMSLTPKKIAYQYGFWLPLFAMLSLVLAMARPQKILHHQEYKGEGIEIMLVLDVSPSMLALDFDPNRLEVAKELAVDFVQKRKGDKIGLTVFSGEAYTKCPLTMDYGTLTKLIEEVTPEGLEYGTAIGMGMATAINQLKEGKAKSKIMVLLTDGFNNVKTMDPLEATGFAKTMGIKVYTIGMGTKGIVKMPTSFFNGKLIFAPAKSDFDEELLMKIAKETGGIYQQANTKEKLKAIYKKINQLERSKIDVITHHQKIEYFRPFLLLGMALFCVYWLLLFLWIRPLP